MLTPHQKQVAESLRRLRPQVTGVFDNLDFAVWSACVRSMATNLRIDERDSAEFRRLANEKPRLVERTG